MLGFLRAHLSDARDSSLSHNAVHICFDLRFDGRAVLRGQALVGISVRSLCQHTYPFLGQPILPSRAARAYLLPERKLLQESRFVIAAFRVALRDQLVERALEDTLVVVAMRFLGAPMTFVVAPGDPGSAR